MSREGSAYVRRGFQEDGPDLDAGNFFDLTLPIWRTAEVLRHAAWLAKQLGAGPDNGIRFAGRYSGLAGRELISWSKPGLRFALEERYRSRSDSVDLGATTSAAEIIEDFDTVVTRILQPLYERFDGFTAPQALIVGQINEFERNVEDYS